MDRWAAQESISLKKKKLEEVIVLDEASKRFLQKTLYIRRAKCWEKSFDPDRTFLSFRTMDSWCVILS